MNYFPFFMTAMLFHSLTMKSRKTLAYDISDTFAKHSGLLSDVTDKNYLSLNGSSHGHIF